MNEKLKLRPATADDAEALAHLWMVAFPDKFGPVLGERGEQILHDWLRLSQRHLQTTTVVEIDQELVAYIILETPAAPHADSGRWLWRALQLHNGIFGVLRRFILMILIDNNYEPTGDEVYIEMLGVDPAWRGRGLGTRLVAYAEAIARQEQVSQLTLNVVCDNAPAIRLYRKLGFEIRRSCQNRTLAWVTGHRGYYQMAKRLRY